MPAGADAARDGRTGANRAPPDRVLSIHENSRIRHDSAVIDLSGRRGVRATPGARSGGRRYFAAFRSTGAGGAVGAPEGAGRAEASRAASSTVFRSTAASRSQ